MKILRVAIGLALAVLGTLAFGALRIPAPPDLFLLVVADMARGGAAIPAMLAALPAGLLAGAVILEAVTLTFLLWILRGTLLAPAPGLLLLRAAATGLFGGALHAASRVPWRQRREARRRMRLT